MLFHNVDISSEDYQKLREEGAIKFRDIDPQMKAEIDYLISNLNQSETQTLVDHMYQTVLTIAVCRTVTAVLLRVIQVPQLSCVMAGLLPKQGRRTANSCLKSLRGFSSD